MTPEEKKAKAKERYDRWRKANPERFKAIQSRYRETHIEECRERVRKASKKAYDEGRKTQYRNANPEGYRNWYDIWYAENKQRLSLQRADYRSTHKEQRREQDKKYRQENAAYLKQKRAEWLLKNAESERIKARDRRSRTRSERAAYLRKWRADNPEKALADRHRRDPRLCASGTHYTPDDLLLLKRRQRNKCATCRESISSGFEVDHVMPLSKGGTNAADNIQLLCRRCNRRKSAKHPDDWAAENGLLFC